MRILFISYPLLPVSDQSCGGAEQMLWTLERELHYRGHETAVAACDGSQISGRLIATGAAAAAPDKLPDREAEHNARILAAFNEARASGKAFDVVHDESGLFWRSVASQVAEPVLATLHLPLEFYGAEAFTKASANVSFNFVSQSQRNAFVAEVPALSCGTVVQNGIALDRFPFRENKEDYLLWLGRICEEKGTHVALEVAERAGLPLIVVGQVYPFSYHQQYFDQQIAPKLGENLRFVEQPDFATKCELLARARALVTPTLIEETSSLVAIEAMACGTPVVAFRRGALGEVVQNNETGFLVDSPDEMVGALANVNQISPRACRQRAEHFSATRMATEYEALYATVIEKAAARAA